MSLCQWVVRDVRDIICEQPLINVVFSEKINLTSIDSGSLGSNIFSLNQPHWADSVIESPCPSVRCSVSSGAVFSEASHWPLGHMMSSRPLISH